MLVISVLSVATHTVSDLTVICLMFNGVFWLLRRVISKLLEKSDDKATYSELFFRLAESEPKLKEEE